MTTKTSAKQPDMETPETSRPMDHKTPVEMAQQNGRSPLPFITLWQDESNVIQVKLGNGITPANAIALLELGLFRYKMMLLPSVSPRPVQAPEGSELPQGSTPKD